MNRAKSITDIGNIYLEMQKRNSASTIDESFLYESTNNKKTQKVKAKEPKNTFPKSTDNVKEPSTFKKGGPNNVKNLTKPKKNKKFSQNSKKIVGENINNFMSIFDKLYENVMKSDELDIDTGIGTGPEGSLGDTELDIESDTESSDNDGDVTLTLNKDLAKELLDLLQAAVGDDQTDTDLEDLGVDSGSEDEDENESCDDDDDDDHEESEEVKYETTELQKLPDSTGHKLTKSGTVGNIKASSGKADSKVTDEVGTETGKHPLDHKSELTNHSKNKVGNLKTGRGLFD
jgi:hypothetical protein